MHPSAARYNVHPLAAIGVTYSKLLQVGFGKRLIRLDHEAALPIHPARDVGRVAAYSTVSIEQHIIVSANFDQSFIPLLTMNPTMLMSVMPRHESSSVPRLGGSQSPQPRQAVRVGVPVTGSPRSLFSSRKPLACHFRVDFLDLRSKAILSLNVSRHCGIGCQG